jgi:hypothetical protein
MIFPKGLLQASKHLLPMLKLADDIYINGKKPAGSLS